MSTALKQFVLGNKYDLDIAMNIHIHSMKIIFKEQLTQYIMHFDLWLIDSREILKYNHKRLQFLDISVE